MLYRLSIAFWWCLYAFVAAFDMHGPCVSGVCRWPVLSPGIVCGFESCASRHRCGTFTAAEAVWPDGLGANPRPGARKCLVLLCRLSLGSFSSTLRRHPAYAQELCHNGGCLWWCPRCSRFCYGGCLASCPWCSRFTRPNERTVRCSRRRCEAASISRCVQ